jgi:Protein of unknown function (DUF3800)
VKLFYIDESGTGLKDKASMFFVLAAVGVEAVEASKVDHAVIALKRQLISWAKPEDFEIKGRAIRRGEGLFSSYRWEQRAEVILMIARAISTLNCNAVVVMVDKRALPKYIGTDDDLYRIAFW